MRRNGKQFEQSLIDLVAHDMTIDFYMFSSFMEDGVRGYLNDGLIVAVKSRGLNEGYPKIVEKIRVPLNLDVVDAKAQYSASEELRETVGCFFERQEMREGPRYTENPVMERRVSRQPAQSESLKALSCRVP